MGERSSWKVKWGERRRRCSTNSNRGRSKAPSWEEMIKKLFFTLIFHDKAVKNINNECQKQSGEGPRGGSFGAVLNSSPLLPAAVCFYLFTFVPLLC